MLQSSKVSSSFPLNLVRRKNFKKSATLIMKILKNLTNAYHILANNRAQEFWAFSAPAHEPNFDPAGMTAPAPSPMHNFLTDCKDFNLQGNKNIQMRYVMVAIIKRWPLLNCHGIGSTLFWLINHYNIYTSIGRHCCCLYEHTRLNLIC